MTLPDGYTWKAIRESREAETYQLLTTIMKKDRHVPKLEHAKWYDQYPELKARLDYYLSLFCASNTETRIFIGERIGERMTLRGDIPAFMLKGTTMKPVLPEEIKSRWERMQYIKQIVYGMGVISEEEAPEYWKERKQLQRAYDKLTSQGAE